MLLPGVLDLTSVNAMAPSTAAAIKSKALQCLGKEAQFVAEMDLLLAGIAQKAGLRWDSDVSKAEYRVAWPGEENLQHGRIDRLLFNRVVVEYEPPGSLTSNNAGARNRHAITQAQNYLKGMMVKLGQEADSIAGVVTDGSFFIYCRFSAGQWVEEAPLPCDAHSVGRFLRLLLTFRKEALLPDTVVERFGETNDQTALLVKELYRALKKPQSPLTAALYSQWLDFFSDIAGLEAKELGQKKSLMEFARRVTGDKSPDSPRLLFALYTYSAIVVKLLTVMAVLPFVDPHKADQIEHWSQFSSDALREQFKSIEAGEFFARHVSNFTEGDFFGWYTGEWSQAIFQRLMRAVVQLAQYDMDAVEQAPERVQDLLKSLYHGLFPKDVRHDLGEYYTPDWLAERLLARVDPDLFRQFSSGTLLAERQSAARLVHDRLTTTSFLDPSCGSGTFLVLVIRRLRQWARECGLDEQRDLLPALFANIRGFDLNPLAVISSRANFLLAVADLLREDDQPSELPVYIADSIVTPAKGNGIWGHGKYSLPLRGLKDKRGEFIRLPIHGHIAADPQRVYQLSELLTRHVPQEVPVEKFLRLCSKAFGLPPRLFSEAEESLTEIYTTLLELHKEKRNGIWANIARNMFMPILMPRVDYVIGNPPWVNWESLPAHYRDASKTAWETYGLFVHGGMDTILGKGKKDVSMLLTYVAADLYLNEGGKLGFVITQSVFKSSGAGQGFRRFVLPDKTGLKVSVVEDLSSFQPFESATNRTALFVLEKGRKTEYPVPYVLVRKKARASIPYRVGLEKVAHLMAETRIYAEPVDGKDPTSAWICAGKRALKALQKLRAPSHYRAYAGACSGGANAVYWLRVLKQNRDGTVRVENITEGAKRFVKKGIHDVEPTLLYPLLRGRDVHKWRALPEESAMFLITQDRNTREGIPEEEMLRTCPRLHKYLVDHKDVLLERRSQSLRRLMNKVFYAMFAVGEYTFSDHKVVWAEVANKLRAAVVSPDSGKTVIPDHTVILIPCADAAEAHYLCALLNASPAQLAIQQYIVLHPDPHVLKNILLPRFKSADKTHKKLAELSMQAHALVAKGAADTVFGHEERKKLDKVEKDIDAQAAALWGLSQDELSEIVENLKELA